MTSIGILITVLTLIVVPTNLFAQWQLSKGNLKVAYPLLMVVYSFYITIETILALNDPSQISILLFNIVNIWAFVMAYKGMKRLQTLREEQELKVNVDLNPENVSLKKAG